MTTTSWRPLSGDGTDLVLCVDFAGGRAEAGFADLAAVTPTDATFLAANRIYTEPAPLAACVDRWAGEALRTGRPIRGVLGFCAGAVLATAIADAVTESGARPPAILLFDAVTVTGPTLCDQFVRAVESAAAHLTADELAAARQLAEELGSAEPPRIAAGLVDRYRDLVTRMAADLGLGTPFRDELITDFTAYMSYLLIAADGTLRPRTGDPVFLSSADHELDGPAPIRFPVARENLLGDTEVAKTVADLLHRA